jgi:ankyrin repeat protein
VSKVGSSQEWGAGYRLREAAACGDVQTTQVLLDAGIDPDCVSIQVHGFFRPWIHGRPALWHAAAQGNIELLNLLLDRGANPNQVGWISSTALWTACCLGHVEVVARLLAAGADPNLPGARNTKPLDAWMGLRALPAWAQGDSVHFEIGALLMQAGASLEEVEDLVSQARMQMNQVGYPQERLEEVVPLKALIAQQQSVELEEGVDKVDKSAGSRRL